MLQQVFALGEAAFFHWIYFLSQRCPVRGDIHQLFLRHQGTGLFLGAHWYYPLSSRHVRFFYLILIVKARTPGALIQFAHV